MTNEVGDLGADGSVDGESDTAIDDAGDVDIGEGDALANEEGACGDVGFQGLQGAQLAVGEELLVLL